MFAIQSFNFEKVCDVVREDGFYQKAKDGLPKNMQVLEKATEQQLAAFAIHRTGINEHVLPWLPTLNIIPSPIKKYQALIVVDRGNKTFLETMEGFKVARVVRVPHGTAEPILHEGKSVIINLSEHKIAFSRIALFFTGFWAAYQEGKKNALLKRMFRK
ncbi:hypothetical protein ABM698_000141 [Salmonella enterica subsp. enterica serovar Newport]|nr:hypothetical protein [Salmonella enterica subsp. enterica serovar Enteritidis]